MRNNISKLQFAGEDKSRYPLQPEYADDDKTRNKGIIDFKKKSHKKLVVLMPVSALRRGDLPEKEGEKGLTLTAAVTQHFHTEAAMFGRDH